MHVVVHRLPPRVQFPVVEQTVRVLLVQVRVDDPLEQLPVHDRQVRVRPFLEVDHGRPVPPDTPVPSTVGPPTTVTRDLNHS